MKEFALKVRRFLLSEEGPTSIEYALILALIVIVAIGGLRLMRILMPVRFAQVAKSLK